MTGIEPASINLAPVLNTNQRLSVSILWITTNNTPQLQGLAVIVTNGKLRCRSSVWTLHLSSFRPLLTLERVSVMSTLCPYRTSQLS